MRFSISCAFNNSFPLHLRHIMRSTRTRIYVPCSILYVMYRGKATHTKNRTIRWANFTFCECLFFYMCVCVFFQLWIFLCNYEFSNKIQILQICLCAYRFSYSHIDASGHIIIEWIKNERHTYDEVVWRWKQK